MTHERDFDRTVRAWLDLMPDEAPDRSIAAVLHAVESTPQVRRPLRRLMRRFRTMTRLPVAATLAAALVLAVGGGLLLMRPTQQPGVGTPTPSRSFSPSPSASAIPTTLRARWMGGNRPLVAARAGSSILFADGYFEHTQSNEQDTKFLASSASADGEGTIRLDKNTDGRCQYTDVGRYSWSVSASGRILTITANGDACASRLAAVSGVWWRMGCKNLEDPCLGDLDAGTYQSQFIAPRLDPGAEWAPNFGAMTYTVPDGWANDSDFPSTFGLQPSSEYAQLSPANPEPTSSMFMFTQPTAESQQTPCSGKPQPGVRRTVADEMRWLRRLPGLVTTQPAAITIDGHQGQWIDLRLDPAWKTGCGDDKPFVEYLLSGDASAGIVGLVGEERQRLVLLDLGDGDLLGIQLRSSDPARFEAFAAEAMPIIQSFQFE